MTRSGPWTVEPDRGLLTNGTIKSPGALRVRWTVKPPHAVSAPHWTVRHVGSVKPLWHIVMRRSPAIKPARTLVVRPVESGRLIVAPGSTALVPPWRVRSGGTHVSGPVVPGGGVSSIMRRCVSWGVTVLSDRRQRSSTDRRLEDGLGWRGKRGGIQIEWPIVGVFTVGALEPRDWAHLCRVFLV